MKISTFACAELDDKSGFVRCKITVDTREGVTQLYPFMGGKHTVCNHEPTSLPAGREELFQQFCPFRFVRA